MRWLLWLVVGVAFGWLAFSIVALLVLAYALSGAPEVEPHRTGDKPLET